VKLVGHDYPFKRHLRPIVRFTRYRGLDERDALIAAYPKSGSTWLRFILTELVTGDDPEWRVVNETIPYVGGHRRAPRALPDGGRLLLTHDRASGQCRRGVYLARDVRDVAMSSFRWAVRGGEEVELQTFLDRFVAGRINPFGSWTAHVRYWLGSDVARRGDLHVVRYEDLRHDPVASVRDVVDHLGIDRSNEEIARSIEHNELNRMRAKERRAPAVEVKARASAEPFVGQGSLGSWRSKLSSEDVALIDRSAHEELDRLGYST
jgi:estrone sulfotransferase